MGVYMLKVTGRNVKLADGRTARKCEYAYKPVSFFVDNCDVINNKAHRASQAARHDREAKKGNREGLIEYCGVVVEGNGRGSLTDAQFDNLPRVDVEVVE